jgi:epoxyqueuosine reductase
MKTMANSKRMLLHACCGPCLIYPLESLRNRQETIIDIYYYNPNIHPLTEYINRLEAIGAYCTAMGVDLKLGDYEPRTYFNEVNGNEARRCQLCYGLRLKATAKFAFENGYSSFSTTLTVSPYQDHEALLKVGEDSAKAFGVDFVYEDFRGGFREGQNKAKELGLYRQKYCGCIYSETERYEKKLDRMIRKVEANENGRV